MLMVGQSGFMPNNCKKCTKLSRRKFRYLNTHKIPKFKTIFPAVQALSQADRSPRIINAVTNVDADVSMIRPSIFQSHQP